MRDTQKLLTLKWVNESIKAQRIADIELCHNTDSWTDLARFIAEFSGCVNFSQEPILVQRGFLNFMRLIWDDLDFRQSHGQNLSAKEMARFQVLGWFFKELDIIKL